MATMENGANNSKSSRRGISFEFQSKDLPSRRMLGKGLSGIGHETAWKGARLARKDFVGVQRDVFLQEAAVLVGLKDHENIVKTYGWTVDKRSCSLVLEYMDEDLLSLLQKRMESKPGVIGKDLGKPSSTSTCTQPFDLFEAVEMMLQIAEGLWHLHQRGLVHGDLKTKNILVTHRKDGDQSSKVLKLSDFGLVGSKRKSKSIVSRKVRKLDMVRWKSPECLKILSRRLHSSNGDEDETSSESESESAPCSVPEVSTACAGTKSSDVYSFGLICYQILTGNSPYRYLDWKELMFKILSGFRPDLPASLHPLLRDLLMSCWGVPAERPSFSTVCVKLMAFQTLLLSELGERLRGALALLVADSPAHHSAAGPSREVSTSSGNCPSLERSRGPAVVPSGRTASVAIVTKNSPGLALVASSAPSPPATAVASPAADESDEPIQSENLDKGLEASLLRDVKTALPGDVDPSMIFRTLPFLDQLDSTSSGLNNDPFTGWDDLNLAGRSSLGKFTENEVVISQHCYRSATGVQTGTRDTGNVVVCEAMRSLDSFYRLPTPASLLKPTSAFFTSFKVWRYASDSLFSQRKREKSKNQWLLRRCLTLQSELQQGVQTHGAVSQTTASQEPSLDLELLQGVQTHGADSPSTVTQRPSLISSCESDFLSNMDSESFPHYMASAWHPSRCGSNSMPHLVDDEAARNHTSSESRRRVQQQENFTALRRLVPIISNSDKASIPGDAIVYLKHLQGEIHGLEASKTRVERQYMDLELCHQDLEQRNQQLGISFSQLERQYEDLKLTHQDLERRTRLLEARIFQDDREFEGFKSFPEEIQKMQREAKKKSVKNEFEDVKLSDLVLGHQKKQFETTEKPLPTVCKKDEPK